MKIIALVDGSVYAQSVCELAGWAGARLGAGVELLHVLGRRMGGAQDFSGSLRLGARTALLEELAALDAQRAKLALLGLDAKITEREQAGRTVYRVRIGPFEARAQADAALERLQAAGVDSTLVRVERQ